MRMVSSAFSRVFLKRAASGELLLGNFGISFSLSRGSGPSFWIRRCKRGLVLGLQRRWERGGCRS